MKKLLLGPSAAGGGSSGFEDEPPLLEELGIHPDHILQGYIFDIVRFKGYCVLRSLPPTPIKIPKEN